MLDKIPKDENTSKFDANGIKKFNEKKWTDAETVVVHLEYLKMLQWALSKRLPTERYMGIMNLYYIIVYPNATTQEIESALVINIQIKFVILNKISKLECIILLFRLGVSTFSFVYN